MTITFGGSVLSITKFIGHMVVLSSSWKAHWKPLKLRKQSNIPVDHILQHTRYLFVNIKQNKTKTATNTVNRNNVQGLHCFKMSVIASFTL